jgi:dTDP-4-dehydrorhamnose reductase
LKDSLLITGGSGFVGGHLARMASSRWNTYVTYHKTPIEGLTNIVELDITNSEATKKIISDLKPKTIIHTAAFAKADYCIEHQNAAWQANVIGTKNILLAAEQVGNVRVIFISTDLVFQGNKSLYSEKNLPTPLCYYGKIKLEAEKIVSKISSNYCIARTALIYGWSLNSSKVFTETMINQLRQGNQVRLFIDEYRTPIYIKNLCAILLELAHRDELQGLYHICGSTRLSRFEFGLELATIWGFDKKLIVPTSVDNFRFKDFRPKDCSMSHKKAESVLKTRFWNIREGLTDMKE